MHKNFWNGLLFFFLAVWALLPVLAFGFQLLHSYTPSGGYKLDPVSASQLLTWVIGEPEFTILHKIAFDRVVITLIVTVLSTVLALLVVCYFSLENQALIAELSIIGFF